VSLVQDLVGRSRGMGDTRLRQDGTSKPFGCVDSRLSAVRSSCRAGFTAATPSTILPDDLKTLQYASILSRFANGGSYIASTNATQRSRLLTTQRRNYLWQPSNQAGQRPAVRRAFYRCP